MAKQWTTVHSSIAVVEDGGVKSYKIYKYTINCFRISDIDLFQDNMMLTLLHGVNL